MIFLEIGMTCEQDVQCIQLAYCARNESAPTTELKKCQCRDEFLDNDGTCSSEWTFFNNLVRQ